MSNPSSFHLEYGQGMVLGYICTSRFCTLVGTEVLDSLFALIVPVWSYIIIENRTSHIHGKYLLTVHF